MALGEWPAPDGDTLAAGAAALVRDSERSWAGLGCSALFAPDRTLALRATSSASSITDVRWVTLKVKDGLVDAQRELHGRRSSIDKRSPDLSLRVWLRRDHASLLLDTSGEPLDRRGYRARTVAAPVRENIAAACVLASRWDGSGPVVDPMCGSGTLLIEAATFALGRAAGSNRRGWAFQKLPNYDERAFAGIQAERREAPGPGVEIFGADTDSEALEAAVANLSRARLKRRATLSRTDAWELEPPPGPGLLLVNPPYGERLAGGPDQWRRLGDLFKQRYKGWRAVVLAGDTDRGKFIGLKPSLRLPVRNGPLDARILVFDLY